MSSVLNRDSVSILDRLAEVGGKAKSVIQGMNKSAAQEELEVSRKNWIINGDMQVSQRGVWSTESLSNSYVYYVDRWSGRNSVTAANITHSTAILTVSSVVSDTILLTATEAGYGYFKMRQPMEEYAKLLGKTVTISAMVKSNNANARILDNQVTGTFTVAHTGGGEWEALVSTFVVPTNASSFHPAIGVMGNDGGVVTVSIGDYIEFTNVSLEIGDTATPFEVEPYAEVLRKCQRYYQKSYNDDVAPATVTNSGMALTSASGTTLLKSVEFATPMRAAPTVTIYSNATGAGATISSGGEVAISQTVVGQTSFYIVATVVDNASVSYHWVAEAEL